MEGITMSKSALRRFSRSNVNVTLGPPDTGNPFAGMQFPCSTCGNGLDIRLTRKNKPYTLCLDCGIRTFFRGKEGIGRLVEILNSEILISGKASNPDLAVILFNRVQQLRTQKKQLTDKQGLILSDPDLRNAIRVVENEIKRVQQELSELASRKMSRKDIK
jgi:hypothetical protein